MRTIIRYRVKDIIILRLYCCSREYYCSREIDIVYCWLQAGGGMMICGTVVFARKYCVFVLVGVGSVGCHVVLGRLCLLALVQSAIFEIFREEE